MLINKKANDKGSMTVRKPYKIIAIKTNDADLNLNKFLSLFKNANTTTNKIAITPVPKLNFSDKLGNSNLAPSKAKIPINIIEMNIASFIKMNLVLSFLS